MPLNSQKVTVWCTIMAEGESLGHISSKMGPTMKLQLMGNTIETWLMNLPAFEVMMLTNFWFQQNGATYRTATENQFTKRKPLGGRIILRRVPAAWPSISYGLTLLG